MNIEILKSQKAEARRNTFKPASDLRVGDFLYLTMCNLKNDGNRMIRVIEDAVAEGFYSAGVLCKIEKIVHCSDEELFSNSFEFGKGGSDSDVFESGEELKAHYPQDDFHRYFYTLVTLVISDGGKFVFADAEGYDYPRYILVRDGYREMFRDEIEQERLAREAREKADEAERAREREEQKRKLAREVSEEFGYLDPKKSVKANWIAVCKRLFDFPVKVSKRSDYSGEPQIILICRNHEECSRVAQTVRELESRFRYSAGEYESPYDFCPGEAVGNAVDDVVPGFFRSVDVE